MHKYLTGFICCLISLSGNSQVAEVNISFEGNYAAFSGDTENSFIQKYYTFPKGKTGFAARSGLLYRVRDKMYIGAGLGFLKLNYKAGSSPFGFSDQIVIKRGYKPFANHGQLLVYYTEKFSCNYITLPVTFVYELKNRIKFAAGLEATGMINEYGVKNSKKKFLPGDFYELYNRIGLNATASIYYKPGLKRPIFIRASFSHAITNYIKASTYKTSHYPCYLSLGCVAALYVKK